MIIHYSRAVRVERSKVWTAYFLLLQNLATFLVVVFLISDNLYYTSLGNHQKNSRTLTQNVLQIPEAGHRDLYE